jgi:hypothetical protein
MNLSAEELRLVRKANGYDPSDASHDAAITRVSPYIGPGYVPDDEGFYTDLKAIAEALSLDPKGMLVVMASESNFYPGTIGPPSLETKSGTLKGVDVTTRGLIGFTKAMVPTIMSADEWKALPKLTARQQLPYVLKVYKQTSEQKGRPLSGTYELYMVTAAPGAVTASGRYNLFQTLYSGRDWEYNLPLDGGPPISRVGVPTGTTWDVQAQKDGLSPKAMTLDERIAYAKSLADKGILKGRVTLGDLQRHLDRMGNKGWRAAWQVAWRRYNEANGLPVEPIALVDPDLASMPETMPPLALPSESELSASRVEEPIPLTATGALDFRLPVYLGSSALGVAALSVALYAGYHFTRK